MNIVSRKIQEAKRKKEIFSRIRKARLELPLLSSWRSVELPAGDILIWDRDKINNGLQAVIGRVSPNMDLEGAETLLSNIEDAIEAMKKLRD
jgi:hypothetical protein